MNNLQLEFSTITVVLNVAVRCFTAIIFMAFLLPLLLKEATVKNGLKQLRIEMLLSGTIIFLVNTVGLFIILFRFLEADVQTFSDFVTYFNTFGFLAYAIVKLRVYTQKYSPENKKLHEEFERIEAKKMAERKAKRATKVPKK